MIITMIAIASSKNLCDYLLFQITYLPCKTADNVIYKGRCTSNANKHNENIRICAEQTTNICIYYLQTS